jgi:GT2 family glycosyltransferase
MTQVAVVILNYNGEALLGQFLPSIIKHSTAARVFVADNCSTDNSIQLVRQSFPGVEVISIPSNLGYSGGYNYALKRIDAEYFILLNSDVQVTANWIAPVIQQMERDASIAAAQPKILSFHNPHQFEYAGAGGGFIDTLGYPFCRGRIFQDLEEDRGQYNDTVPVFWATGACLFIRSTAFHKMGGLDEEFFAHMEEIDLCWRLKRDGFSIYYVGASEVYHVGGGTLSAGNPRKTYYNFRNGLSLLAYHLPLGQLLWKLPLRLALDWVAATKFCISSPKDGLAVLKAHGHFFLRINEIAKRRKSLNNNLRGAVPSGIYSRLLVFDHYLLKRRWFAQLKAFQ